MVFMYLLFNLRNSFFTFSVFYYHISSTWSKYWRIKYFLLLCLYLFLFNVLLISFLTYLARYIIYLKYLFIFFHLIIINKSSRILYYAKVLKISKLFANLLILNLILTYRFCFTFLNFLYLNKSILFD